MIGDGTGLYITNTGSASLHSHHKTFPLNDVLCVPDMKKNLISISQFCSTNDVSIEFLSSFFHVKDFRTGVILLKGTTKDNVYEWPSVKSESSPILAFVGVKTSSINWHHRLGHPAYPVLKHIISNFSLDLSSPMSKESLCNACHCNKSHKLPFSNSSLISSHPLEIIYSDVWTSPVISHDGFKYYDIFVDHLTKYIWFYPLKKKIRRKRHLYSL